MAKISKKELENFDLNVLIKIYNETDGMLGHQINLLNKKYIIDSILKQEEWSINEIKINKKYKNKIENKKIIFDKNINMTRLKHTHHTGCSFIEDSEEDEEIEISDTNWLWDEVNNENDKNRAYISIKDFMNNSF